MKVLIVLICLMVVLLVFMISGNVVVMCKVSSF